MARTVNQSTEESEPDQEPGGAVLREEETATL